MIKKTHTRNQKRMYRIHKQEEQIEKDKIIIAEQQIELDKYKEVLDKIKKYIKEKDLTNNMNFMDDGIGNLFKDILELLEEIK